VHPIFAQMRQVSNWYYIKKGHRNLFRKIAQIQTTVGSTRLKVGRRSILKCKTGDNLQNSNSNKSVWCVNT